MSVDPDACITCGDTAVTGTVVEVGRETAVVEVGGRLERVGIELVTPVAVGDRILCHAGIALQQMDRE